MMATARCKASLVLPVPPSPLMMPGSPTGMRSCAIHRLGSIGTPFPWRSVEGLERLDLRRDRRLTAYWLKNRFTVGAARIGVGKRPVILWRVDRPGNAHFCNGDFCHLYCFGAHYLLSRSLSK